MTDKLMEEIDSELRRMDEIDCQGYSDDIRYLCGLLTQCRDRMRWVEESGDQMELPATDTYED